jgi:hypothetical protein
MVCHQPVGFIIFQTTDNKSEIIKGMKNLICYLALFSMSSGLNVWAQESDCSLKITGVVKDVSCFGGSDGLIDISITGGSVLLYIWSNGSIDEDLTGIRSGNYTVIAKANMCSDTATFTIKEPERLSVKIIEKKDASCYNRSDGQIKVEGLGGVSPYLYLIENNNNFSSSEIFSGLEKGDYLITVKDRNGCTATNTAHISAPPEQSINLGSPQSIISGSEFVLDAGKGFLSYLWNSGQSTQKIIVQKEVSDTVTEEYFVTVTDLNGCVFTSDKLKLTFYPNGHTFEDNNHSDTIKWVEPKKLDDINSKSDSTVTVNPYSE